GIVPPAEDDHVARSSIARARRLRDAVTEELDLDIARRALAPRRELDSNIAWQFPRKPERPILRPLDTQLSVFDAIEAKRPRRAIRLAKRIALKVIEESVRRQGGIAKRSARGARHESDENERGKDEARRGFAH